VKLTSYWALLGPGVSLRRTSHDLQAAADEIRRTSRWPEAESFAAQNVLQPPSADEALAYFQQLENRTRAGRGGRSGERG
jgi:hypothetical protein